MVLTFFFLDEYRMFALHRGACCRVTLSHGLDLIFSPRCFWVSHGSPSLKESLYSTWRAFFLHVQILCCVLLDCLCYRDLHWVADPRLCVGFIDNCILSDLLLVASDLGTSGLDMR